MRPEKAVLGEEGGGMKSTTGGRLCQAVMGDVERNQKGSLKKKTISRDGQVLRH